jgi:hypothetical protein
VTWHEFEGLAALKGVCATPVVSVPTQLTNINVYWGLWSLKRL